jgi:hypothetical protein
MTARQLQEGADWLYRQFYRLDRIVWRTIRAALGVGSLPAYLGWRLNMTYRYDNRRDAIVGRNPALAEKPSLLARLRALAARRVKVAQASGGRPGDTA